MNGLALFAGYGGLELGADAAFGGGVRTVCYVERESYAASTLVARMEEASLDQAPIWDDVTTFDGKPWRGVVDLVTAGFPCQPFSAVGKRMGTEDERWVWSDISRIIGEVRPRWFVGENVVGLANKGGGLLEILGSLATLGYDAIWGALRASEVGATQRRERLFILAKLADADRSGLQGHGGEPERQVRRQESQRQVGGGGLQMFAPRVDEVVVWGRVLEESPSLEPSVCRMDSRASERLEYAQDRIRTLGNGVVPLQAAVAIRMLADRAGWVIC